MAWRGERETIFGTKLATKTNFPTIGLIKKEPAKEGKSVCGTLFIRVAIQYHMRGPKIHHAPLPSSIPWVGAFMTQNISRFNDPGSFFSMPSFFLLRPLRSLVPFFSCLMIVSRHETEPCAAIMLGLFTKAFVAYSNSFSCIDTDGMQLARSTW